MSSSAAFIGRIGGLAVALGIGAAIANSPGIAAAETPSDAPAAGVSQTGADHTPASATTASATTPKADTEPAPSNGGTAASSAARRSPRTATSRRPLVRAQRTLSRLVTAKGEPRATKPDDEAPDRPPAPEDTPAAVALAGVARREIGHDNDTASRARTATATTTATAKVAAVTAQPAGATSPLGTPDQLAAEKLAKRVVNTLPVALVKLALRAGFLSAAKQQFDKVGGPDQGNLDRLDAAVNAYAMASAFQQQLLNSAEPTVVMQVAPPHTWSDQPGQTVPASRILYDNPDTIYRFMGVNGASKYVITGRFADPAHVPADTTFSVLTGLTGNTAAVLTKDNFTVNPDGTFTITADSTPANGRVNHLQLPADATLIATRNTLSDWGTEVPMSLEITRVGGPPNSLFSQLGGFAIPRIGPAVVRNPVLTKLVSLIPPLPSVPPVLRGAVTAVIMALGIQREATYMAVATTDPATGQRQEPNVLRNPTRNAEFLATQLQSAGYFQLADDQALVLTINPDGAGYFVVPVTDDWTVTKDYWNDQTSLNISQAAPNDDGTYTIVVSPTDPGVANWVSTGGLHQGTLSIRFQVLQDGTSPTVGSQLVTLDELGDVLPPETTYVGAADRAAQLAARKNGFDSRFAPYPQP
ncbi:DUF1214 domain-containing protein [Mycolicibacterium fluoranthenivorans]|uniref:DUF1214 domain-containing protein n=1 Tax=Mycolicibacterium fluoranthenivorans TaxID=258505 RepID=A0A7G8PC49_9MYCO|nr:DUF1214 domain-containing protein [Mycolicibacterium fluoranthenivorans]QNJ91915.1 DUF1214 domain-containing protein [Mycolicibacterium fluoranthenivorans]